MECKERLREIASQSTDLYNNRTVVNSLFPLPFSDLFLSHTHWASEQTGHRLRGSILRDLSDSSLARTFVAIFMEIFFVPTTRAFRWPLLVTLTVCVCVCGLLLGKHVITRKNEFLRRRRNV